MRVRRADEGAERMRVRRADEGNRTPVSSLGSSRSTIELHPRVPANDSTKCPRDSTLAEVQVEARRRRTPLALVLAGLVVGALGRRAHLEHAELTDLHPRVDRDRQVGDVGQFQGQMAAPARIHEPGRRVDQQAEAAQRAFALEPGHQVVRQRHLLERAGEHEPPHARRVRGRVGDRDDAAVRRMDPVRRLPRSLALPLVEAGQRDDAAARADRAPHGAAGGVLVGPPALHLDASTHLLRKPPEPGEHVINTEDCAEDSLKSGILILTDKRLVFQKTEGKMATLSKKEGDVVLDIPLDKISLFKVEGFLVKKFVVVSSDGKTFKFGVFSGGGWEKKLRRAIS